MAIDAIMIDASPIHLQHISVTLKLLEQAFIEIERAVRRPPPHASLTAYCDQIEPSTGLKILELVSDAQRSIEQIVADLGLPKHDQSVARTLLGGLHVRVISLVELQPQYLKRGGAVPQSLAEPRALNLETLLRQLIGLLQTQVLAPPR